MHMLGLRLATGFLCSSADHKFHRSSSIAAARMPGFPQSGDETHDPSTRGPPCPGARLRHSHGTGTSDGLSAFVDQRSEEHTSELQSLMRISYAVFCLKQKIKT